MSQHKYRICQSCNQARSYTYGRQAPTKCSCGSRVRPCTRNEWIMNLQPNTANTGNAKEQQQSA